MDRQKDGQTVFLPILQGLPEWSEGLLEGPKGLPEGPEGLLEGSEGLPEGPEGLPGQSQPHTLQPPHSATPPHNPNLYNFFPESDSSLYWYIISYMYQYI